MNRGTELADTKVSWERSRLHFPPTPRYDRHSSSLLQEESVGVAHSACRPKP